MGFNKNDRRSVKRYPVSFVVRGHFVVVDSVSEVGNIVKYWDPTGGSISTMPIDSFAKLVTGVIYKGIPK